MLGARFDRHPPVWQYIPVQSSIFQYNPVHHATARQTEPSSKSAGSTGRSAMVAPVERVDMTSRLVVAIPSGDHSLYARLVLERLQDLPVEAHVVLPTDPDRAFAESAHLSADIVEEYATGTYANGNIGAPMASGSWSSHGTLVLPANAALLRRIALGLSGTLVTRTADVMLKERNRLVVVPFEPEWNEGTVDHLTTITEAGGTVLPPFPSFYTGIDRVRPMVRRTVERALSQFSFPTEIEEWRGLDGG